jgi:membrane fusion protein
MATNLFRDEVIEAGRDRLAGTVIAATPPRAPVYVALAVVTFACILLLLAFGTFATKIRVTGIVTYSGGVSRLYPPSAVEVRALHVREGQIVAAGAPLATVSVTQGRDPGGDGVQSQIAEIDRQDAELQRQATLADTLGVNDIASLEEQRASLQLAVASLDRQQALGTQQIALSESASDRAARLAKLGAGSRRQADDARATLVARKLDAEALRERTIGQRETLRAIGLQLDQRRLSTDQKRSEISAQRADLAERRAALLRLDRLVLTAPIAGRVSDVIAAVGQRAQPQTSLMTVVPIGSRLEVWLYAPSRAAGFVRVGDTVRLMFDAFPFQKYGAGSGTVVAVSGVPTDAGAIDTGLNIHEPVYRIRVRIDRVSRDVAAERPLRPGMTLASNLITERRRLWEVFLDPVLRAIRR